MDVNPDEKQEVWQQIASQTKGSKATVTTLGSPSIMRWAAAAFVLIGALLGVFYLQFYQQPELIAQSEATINTTVLADGSTVTLRPYSVLYSIEQSNSKHQYKIEGEALFEVTSNQHRTFSVETATGRVSVLGTSFTVSSWGQQMQVFLQEGSVELEALDQDSSIILQPGQSASIADKNGLPTVQTAKVEEFLDWLDQELIFENKAVSLITGEIEQQFNINITLPTNIATNKLTGQLSLQNLETALRDLELVLGGKFAKTGPQRYTFEMD